MPVRIYAVESDDHDHLRQLLGSALDYLATYGPRQYKQLRHRIRRVSIRQLPHLQGAFEEAGPAIVIAEAFLSRSATSPVRVASTLVHEATHARIHELGIRHRGKTAIRIERACTREELRFLDLVPRDDGAALSEVIKAKHDGAAQVWSPEARLDAVQRGLTAVGGPVWLTRLLRWLGPGDHAA
jgi:hypothetical protein